MAIAAPPIPIVQIPIDIGGALKTTQEPNDACELTQSCNRHYRRQESKCERATYSEARNNKTHALKRHTLWCAFFSGDSLCDIAGGRHARLIQLDKMRLRKLRGLSPLMCLLCHDAAGAMFTLRLSKSVRRLGRSVSRGEEASARCFGL